MRSDEKAAEVGRNRFVWLQTILSQMLHKFLRTTLRVGVLTGGAVALLSSLGAWHYLESSLYATDMKHAAMVNAGLGLTQRVVVVAIDDQAFQTFFDEQSPLRKDKLSELLGTIAGAAPRAKRLVVDLDLAPQHDGLQGADLDRVLKAHASRWVLAATDGVTPEDRALRQQWRDGLCRAGVSFGIPMVPTEFGHARNTHQYVGSLSDVALRSQPHCVSMDQPLQVQPSVLWPHSIQTGMVLPFSGDLELLAQTLQAVDPEWVVIGGSWGKDDIFATPFGDRFGLMIHAAALEARLNGSRQLPYFAQVLVAMGFVGVLTWVLTSITLWSDRWSAIPSSLEGQLAGHQFFVDRFRPLLLLGVILGLLLLLVMALGLFWGLTGWWLPSSTVATVTLTTVMLDWNWGRAEIKAYGSLQESWKDTLAEPVLREWRSLRAACLALWGRAPSQAWAAQPRYRLHFEAVMSLMGLVAQTVLPLVFLALTLTKSR